MTESEKLISFLERMKNLVTARILEEQELEMIIKALEEIQQYRAIGTIERFRELTEKAEPKKPIVVERHYFGYIHKIYRCSTCDSKLVSQIDGSWCGGTLSKHCEECGTAIDWQ